MTEGQATFERAQVIIKRGDIIAMRKLLDAGLDPNSRHRFGSTLLMVAAGYGQTRIAELLIARGAIVNMIDKFGSSALADATLEGHCATIRALLEHGATVKVSPHGVSLLTYALWGRGELKTCRHLGILRSAGAT